MKLYKGRKPNRKRSRAPKKRSHADNPSEILVVSPYGAIKTLYYAENMNPPQLLIRRRQDGSMAVDIAPQYKEGLVDRKTKLPIPGWITLADAYKAEGREAAYAKYMEWHRRVTVLHERLEFPPASALPLEVIRRRERVEQPQAFEWTTDPEPKTPKAKAALKRLRKARA